MFIFPSHIFNPDNVQARIVQNTISGGVALNGEEDVISTDGGGRWEITYSGIALDTPELLRAWEAWLDHLSGGTIEVLVPALSLETAPRPYLGTAPAQPSALYTDAELFPEVAQFAEPYIIASAASSAALRATQLAINVTRGAPIEGGEKFSIDGRLHRIGRGLGGSLWKISPPLREAVSLGTGVNFDWPLLRCRAAPGEDFSVPVEMGRFAEAQIRFVEAI